MTTTYLVLSSIFCLESFAKADIALSEMDLESLEEIGMFLPHFNPNLWQEEQQEFGSEKKNSELAEKSQDIFSLESQPPETNEKSALLPKRKNTDIFYDKVDENEEVFRAFYQSKIFTEDYSGDWHFHLQKPVHSLLK